MPRYTPKSHEQILTSMIAKMVARTNLNDVGDSSALKHLLSAAARQDSQQYFQSSLLLELFSIDTAAGEDLDERAKDIQPTILTRIPSSKSVGVVVFTRRGTTGTLSIPAGTKVKTTDGLVFSTTAIGTITATSPEQVTGHGIGRDSNLVSVLADAGGLAGNVAALTVTKFVTKPAGVDSVTNLSAFYYGRDQETDDAFRTRLKKFVASLSRCNKFAMENQLIGAQDPGTNSTIMFAKVVEDMTNRGNVTIYIDDGTGMAESVLATAVALSGTWTWNGTLTVLTTNTSSVMVGDFIRKDSSPTTWFEIDTIVPNTSVTILNPGLATVPTGAGASSRATENVTNGLDGPPPNTAAGGETTLNLNYYPVKDTNPLSIVSSIRGNLIRNTHWIINPASGQIDFAPALVTGEKIMADYIYFTGLIAYAQKIIDGDPNDRENFPGYRAAGVYVKVATPQVLLQNVSANLTVKDGYNQNDVETAVRQTLKDYINNLPISGDLVLSEMVKRMMEVDGVYDVNILVPTANVVILDDQMARTTDSNLTIS